MRSRRRRSLAARFWEKVDVREPDECWPWKSGHCTLPFGYGSIYVNQSDSGLASGPTTAHRVSFYLANGHWPDEARHTCDNPPCCNPRHIIDGTHADNLRDAVERGRNRLPISRAKGEAHGHAKLCEQDVMAIKTRRQQGVPLRELAAEFGVGITTISSVARGKTWAHLS